MRHSITGLCNESEHRGDSRSLRDDNQVSYGRQTRGQDLSKTGEILGSDGMRCMRGKGVLLALLLCSVMAMGQIVTTTLTDTIYHADGTTAGGLVIVSWPAFTTAAGQAVPGGSTSATIGANGVLTLHLAPNQGATPAGTFYTAVYHLDDGAVSRESWSIPVSSTAVALTAVRSTVLPAAVAVQTATKSYVDDAVVAALAGHPGTGNITFLNRTGDAMVGALALAGDPTTGSQAANKHYVDTAVAGVGTAVAQKVGVAPTSTQAVAQPAGTELQVNRINDVEYASQYVTGRGSNGLTNATQTADCAGGCQVAIENEYQSNEPVKATQWNSSATNGTHVEDLRGGGRHNAYLNPMNQSTPGFDVAETVDVTSTRSVSSVHQQTGSQTPSSVALSVTQTVPTGGSNQFPATIAGNNGPFFKTNYNAFLVGGTYNSPGQHVLTSNLINCYGVGDCLIGSQFINASGGFRDEADEGAHPMDIQIHEDSVVFRGACSTGCTTGSTTLGVAVSAGAGTQGEGRFLIDTNPAKTISTGVLTGGAFAPAVSTSIGPTANFAGVTFPVSVFLATAQVAPASAHAMAPGTVTLPIMTSGLPSPFRTSTAALPATSGVACVTDPFGPFSPTNYEMAPYTVVDASHIMLTLGKVHAPGSTIAVGGLCGYGLEQTVDTESGIRQVFPVIGTVSPTKLFYAGNLTPVVGVSGSTSAFLNVSVPIASVSRVGQTTTITTVTALRNDLNNLTATIAGVGDGSFNGQFAVTTTGPNTLTVTNPGAATTSGGGTLTVLTGGYALYPMAEVLGVYNQGTKSVDGQLTLAANLVPWAAGDPVEQPHYFQENVMTDVQFVSQTVPRPITGDQAGINYSDNVGPGLHGWTIGNSAPASNYFGNGGSHGAPDDAFQVTGIWGVDFEAQAGESGVFRLHCNSHGCGKWNSGYDLFQMDSNASFDSISFQPLTSALSFNLRGTTFGFSPQGLTAGTVTAGTLHGALSATDVASGTLNAARLPVFGASGGTHAVGAVPDPGATAGTGRFLREDGLWALAGTSSGGSGGASGTAAINGGSIDNTAIGQTTAAAGRFSQMSVTGCTWFVAGTNQGVGTCTPTSWNAVNGVDGSNLQIYNPGSSRLIVSSSGSGGSMAEFHFVNLGAPSGSRNWRMSNSPQGQYTLDMNADDYSTHTVAMQCLPNGSCRFPNGITAANFNGVLSGMTAVIGGSALGAGACTTGTAAVAGATIGTPVNVSASDGSLPSGLVMLRAAVTSASTVTVQVCAVGAVTPAAVSYNVRVVQ